MAFPTIPTAAAGRIVSVANTNPAGTHTFPNLNTLTAPAGVLIVAIVVMYDGNTTNAEFSGWGASFNEFVDQATATTMGIGAAYKWSSGSETGTFTVTSSDTSANDSVCILLAIPGAHATTPPEGGTITNGTAAAADIAALNPAGWAAEDTLWIAVCGAGETSTTGSFTAPSAAPGNYGDLFATAVSADVVGGVYGAVAFRQLNAASDDPATFTVDTTNARNSALLLAVRPVPAPVEIAGDLAVTVGLSVTEQAVHPVDGSLTVTATETGTAQATYNASGSLTVTVGLTGDADVTAGGGVVNVDGSLAVTAGLAATAQATYNANGDRATTVTLSGTAVPEHTIDGTRPVTAGVTSTAEAIHPVDGSRPITVGLTGDASITQPGQVNADGNLAITALTAGIAALSVPVDGSRSITITLTGTADVVTPGDDPVGWNVPYGSATTIRTYAASTRRGVITS